MLSIITVTYNASAFLNCFLKRVINYQQNDGVELLVIDNASKDGTIDLLEKVAPTIMLIKNDRNIGFASACNQGAKKANGEYLLFINSDTKICEADFLNELFKFADNQHDIGAVGPKILNENGTLQPSVGKFPSLWRIVIDRIKFLNNIMNGILIRRATYYENTRMVDWISASCLLIKRNLFNEIGGFNENIFMYGEDYDLCYRLNKKGYKNYIFTDVKIIHQDTGKNNPLRKPHKYFHMRKGLLLFLKKYKSKFSYYAFKFLIKVESITKLLLLNLKRFNDDEEKNLWKIYLRKSIKLNV